MACGAVALFPRAGRATGRYAVAVDRAVARCGQDRRATRAQRCLDTAAALSRLHAVERRLFDDFAADQGAALTAQAAGNDAWIAAIRADSASNEVFTLSRNACTPGYSGCPAAARSLASSSTS